MDNNLVRPPIRTRATPNVTPFTYYDGLTYLEILEALRKWLTDELAPAFDEYADWVESEIAELVALVDDKIAALESGVAADIDALTDYVDDAVQQVINSSIELQDTVLKGILEDSQSASGEYVRDVFEPKDWARFRIAGDGIDPTGVSDSAAGINAFLSNLPEGARVEAAPNEVFRIADVIQLDKRVTFENVSLILDESVNVGAAIKVGADATVVNKVRLYAEGTPVLGTGTGRLYGIHVTRADDVIISDNHIERFGNGIHLSFSQLPKNARITGNRIKDIQGAATEDKCDGISANGAQSVIIGNIINAMEGSDPRIGISVESLTAAEDSDTVEHRRSNVIVQGNVIYGKFRRGIAIENINTCVVSGNSVSDSTWWAIAVLMNSKNVIVNDNTIVWTRTADDTQGGSWGPTRCPFHARGPATGVKFHSNTVRMKSGSVAANGFWTQGNTYSGTMYYPNNVEFVGNDFQIEPSAVVNSFVFCEGGSRGIRIIDNQCYGDPVSLNGIRIYGGREAEIVGNRVTGTAGNGRGVAIENAGTWALISGNYLVDFNFGIHTPSSRLRRIIGNHIENSSRGLDAFDLRDSVVSANIFKACTTPPFL